MSGYAPWTAVVPVPARVSEIRARIGTKVADADVSGFDAALGTAMQGSTAYAPLGASVAAPRTTSIGGLTAAYETPALGPATGTGTDVVPVALQYLGTPYVWGGNDPTTGVDCSGFTRHVFGSFGVSLPRVSTDQARMGTPVTSLADAKPGDLLAFGSPVDHVAIYLGNGRMVHAAGTGKGVRVDDVYRTPTAIRRLLPTDAPWTIPATGPGVGAGAGAYDALFAAAGARHGLDPSLLSAVARAESGFDPKAVSSAGALGLMQLMPATAASLGVNPLDPAQAIDGAARYLAQQLARFGSVELALAAYNAGPGAVSRYGGVPPFPETQSYVTKVLAHRDAATTTIGASA